MEFYRQGARLAGKKFLGNSKGIAEKLVGGWQIAAIGNTMQGWWSLPTSYYPTGNPIEYYGFKYKIQDCGAAVASLTTCISTAIFRLTGSTVSIPTESQTASRECRRTTSRRLRR